MTYAIYANAPCYAEFRILVIHVVKVIKIIDLCHSCSRCVTAASVVIDDVRYLCKCS